MRNNKYVRVLQKQLNTVLGIRLSIDGHFGPKTQYAVKRFQEQEGFFVTGIADTHTRQHLNDMLKGLEWWKLPRRFVVFVDAGHSGITNEGKYITRGKYMKHGLTGMHDGKGMYYEGLENRFAAELFIQELAKAGIMYVRTYDAVQDTSLSERVRIIKSYLDRDYYGYMHSFHSNAISLNSSKEKLEKTQGGILFTTPAFNKSDIVADIHHQELTKEFGEKWVWGQKKKQFYKDWERNFKVLRESDTIEYASVFAAFMEEFGFHTSLPDTKFIMKNRFRRAKTAVRTAVRVKNDNMLW